MARVEFYLPYEVTVTESPAARLLRRTGDAESSKRESIARDLTRRLDHRVEVVFDELGDGRTRGRVKVSYEGPY